MDMMTGDIVQRSAVLTSAKQDISECRQNTNYAQVLNSSQQLADSFKKCDAEGNQVKSPIATLISIAGVGISTFLLGKNLGKLGTQMAKKLPASFKTTIIENSKKFVETLNAKIGTIKNTKVSNTLTNALGGVVDTVMKDPAKFAANASGAVAVAAMAPDIIKADGNDDGIADIAQKNVNAYRSAIQNFEVVADIASVLS